MFLYLKHAFKSVKRHKVPSLINFIGFSIGLSGAVLLLGILLHDLNFDGYHKKGDSIYRMSVKLDLPSGKRHFGSTSVVSGNGLVEAIPEIDAVVRLRMMPVRLTIGEDIFDNEGFTFVDPSFYTTFSLGLINGSLPQSRDQILISRLTSERVFGQTDPIGEIIRSVGAYGDQGLTVVGVFENYPTNVSFRPSYLADFDLIESLHGQNLASIMPGLSTFLLVDDKATTATINEKINSYYEKNMEENLFQVLKHEVEPYGSMHFTRGLEFDLGQKHDKGTLWLLGVLAVFILASTLINYFNMQLALSVQRTKELSIKKVLGQSFGNKARQATMETMMVLMPAFALSGVGVHFVLKEIEQYTNLSMAEGWLAPERLPLLFFLLFIGFWLLAALISVGIAHFSKTDLAMKKGRRTGGLLRRGLIGLQFALAGFFILSALVISKQLKYMASIDLGYQQQSLITLNLNNVAGYDEARRIKTAFETVAGVNGASVSQSPIFGAMGKANFEIEQDTGNVSQLLNYNYVDESFVSTNGLVLLAGTDIPESRRSLLLNEQAVKALGFTSMDDALGKKMVLSARDTTLEYLIGGIVSDYHYATMHQLIEPIALLKNELGTYYNLSLKVGGQDISNILPQLEARWDELYPGFQFSYQALTDRLDNAYAEDTQKGSFYQWATLLLVTISALGIFGLTYYYADQKRKEIGIRKAIGARLSNILIQVGKPVLWTCIVAAFFALPVAFWLSDQWLTSYQYRIEVDAWSVISTLAIMFFLSAIALMYPGFKASRINPVDALREE